MANNKKKSEDYCKKKEEEANSLLVFLYVIHNLFYIEFFHFTSLSTKMLILYTT